MWGGGHFNGDSYNYKAEKNLSQGLCQTIRNRRVAAARGGGGKGGRGDGGMVGGTLFV